VAVLINPGPSGIHDVFKIERTNIEPTLSGLNPEESGKKRFTYPPQADDLEIVVFHRMDSLSRRIAGR